MAKLVLGTDINNTGIVSIVRDVSPALYREFQLDNTGKLVANTTTTHIMDFTGMTSVSDYMFAYAYYNNTAISGTVDMSDLTTLSGTSPCMNMFYGCTGLTSVNLSGLTTISGNSTCSNMFFKCSGITSVNLSGLTNTRASLCCYRMFEGCTGLTSVDLSSLTSCSYGTNDHFKEGFSGCTELIDVNLSSLSILGCQRAMQDMFKNCSKLTVLSFPCLKTVDFANSISTLITGVDGCTLHFPSNMQSKITGITTTFGGTNTTVLFDLPATNTLTGADTVTYTRNPKYDTGTALAWKVGAYGTTNFTPAYYTSGTIDPVVSDTIYSDAACTTAVTTINSIN